MAGNRLTSRLEALEKRTDMKGLPAVWIIAREGETTEQACERYEAENEPIGVRFILMWRPYQEQRPCA